MGRTVPKINREYLEKNLEILRLSLINWVRSNNGKEEQGTRKESSYVRRVVQTSQYDDYINLMKADWKTVPEDFTTQTRIVWLFEDYPERYLLIFKQSYISVGEFSKKLNKSIKPYMYIDNAQSGRKGGAVFFKLAVDKKTGHVRFSTRKGTWYLSLKTWHVTLRHLSSEIIYNLIALDPTQEYIRTMKLPIQKMPISNPVRRSCSNFIELVAACIGYRPSKKEIKLIEGCLAGIYILKFLREMIPDPSQREAFVSYACDNKEDFSSLKQPHSEQSDSLNGLFVNYYRSRIKKFCSSTEFKFDPWIVMDYVRMCKAEGCAINLRVQSFTVLKRLHDQLNVVQMSKRLPELTVSEKFRIFESDDFFDIELIENKDRLIQESMDMSHCVASYASMIRDGRCAIYSMRKKASVSILDRWTVEVGLGEDPGSFRITQVRGFGNAMPQCEVVEWLNKRLQEVGTKKRNEKR